MMLCGWLIDVAVTASTPSLRPARGTWCCVGRAPAPVCQAVSTSVQALSRSGTACPGTVLGGAPSRHTASFAHLADVKQASPARHALPAGCASSNLPSLVPHGVLLSGNPCRGIANMEACDVGCMPNFKGMAFTTCSAGMFNSFVSTCSAPGEEKLGALLCAQSTAAWARPAM